MKNLLEYVKEKSYYLLGLTVIIIIILIIVSSCSNGSGAKSYDKIEENMVLAANKYYNKHPNLLPNEDGNSVKVNIGTLIDAEVLEDVKDPNNSANSCSGYVEVTKVGEEYSYIPFLTCVGNYEPEYLADKIKNVGVDEYNNGVYLMDNEYVYRGNVVNNYVLFNDLMWRILKVDSAGDIKLVLAKKTEDYFSWDTLYNSDAGYNSGDTRNFQITSIRKTLNSYYDIFTKENKTKIVSKNLCIGSLAYDEGYNASKECSAIKENQKVGLLNPTDYQKASLDGACIYYGSGECTNFNYLASADINTWLLNPSTKNSYTVLYLSGSIGQTYASNSKRINPVIYLSGKVITNAGDGSFANPYKIK